MSKVDNLIKLIEENKLGTYKENVSLKTLTTYKTGGNARLLVFPNSTESLIEILSFIKENNIKYKVFGNGSNILASSKEYNGVIIKLTELKSLKQDYWYQIDTSTDIDQLSQKIKEDLENAVLPYFEDYQTLHGVIEGIQNKKLSPGGSLNYAILLAMIGEIETAKRLLEKEYRSTSYGSQRAVIKRISKELSIELQLTK